jgi:CheY-like chemotaxis protein
LDIIGKTPVSVIISDMRMPEMDGIAFLKIAVAVCPDAVRILLSAYSDIDSVMKAVNEGHIWRYVTKPWDDNDLKLGVRTAIQYYTEAQAHKRLMKEIIVKNMELNTLNSSLEQKVHERTWAIQERSRMLNMIVEEADGEKLFSECCNILAQASGSDEAFLSVAFLDRVFSHPDTRFPEIYAGLARRALKGTPAFEDDGVVCIPLIQKGMVLGSLIVNPATKTDPGELTEKLKDFLAVIILALGQQKALKESSGLLQDIGKILPEL